MKACYGLLGDLAEAFRNGQIKDLLLAEWIAAELRQKGRMSGEVRRNLRYAREVRFVRSLLVTFRILTRRFLFYRASSLPQPNSADNVGPSLS